MRYIICCTFFDRIVFEHLEWPHSETGFGLDLSHAVVGFWATWHTASRVQWTRPRCAMVDADIRAPVSSPRPLKGRRSRVRRSEVVVDPGRPPNTQAIEPECRLNNKKAARLLPCGSRCLVIFRLSSGELGRGHLAGCSASHVPARAEGCYAGSRGARRRRHRPWRLSSAPCP